MNSTIFKTITSSVDESSQTLALFNKDWNTYKTNWQNANSFWGKIGSIFTSANMTKSDIDALKAYNAQIDACVTPQTAFNRTMLDASPAAQNLVSSYNGGKVSAQGMATAQNMAKTSTIGLTIAQTALNTVIGMGIGLLVNLAIQGINKLIHANEDAIKSAKELRKEYEDFKTTNASNIGTLKGLEEEFKELSRGVSQYGDNLSLSTEQYERYKEIIQQIIGMSPSLTEGYDTENGYIADKNNLLERAIKLQNVEYKNELRKITNLENLKTSMTGYIAEYKNAFEGGLVTEDMSATSTIKATDFSNALYQAFNTNDRADYDSEDMAREILKSLGINDVDEEMKKFFNEHGYYQSNWFFNEYIDEIANNINAVTDTLSFKTVGLDETEFESRILTVKDCAQAYLDMKDSISMANESIQTDLRYIAEYAEGYDSLSTEQQKFVYDFLKGFNIDDIASRDWFGNLTYDEDKMKSVKRQINDFVDALSKNETTKDALADLYAIPTDEQSVNEFVEQFRNALKIIKAYCEENKIGIPIAIANSEKTINDLETKLQHTVNFAKDKFNDYDPTDFFKANSINTQEEIDKWLEIAQTANSAADAEERYVQCLVSDSEIDVSLDKYKTASDSISSLATAFNELTDNEYISLETISKIKEAVGDSISNWDEYEQKLMSVKKGTAEYNQLVSELTYTTLEKQLGGVNALAQADEKYVAQLLKENGVLNANEVAHNAVERAKAKEWIQSQSNDNITDKNIKSLIAEAKTAGISKNAYLELTAKEILFNNNQINTKQKCQQILAIAQAANVASTEYNTLKSNIDAWKKTELLGSGTRTKTAQDAGMTVISEKNRKDKNHTGKGNLYIASDGKEFEKYEDAMYYQEALNNVSKISDAYSNINYVLPDYSDTTTSSFKETFNWIETALSRVQRAVTNFGKTVAATWQSWTMRNNALKDQMSAIRNEISLQDQAYSKYKALADSVGLSEGYKTLVREGSINIETIESESIAEAIKLYQEYYEKALAAKDASADLKDELAALTQTKFSNLAQSFAALMSGNEHSISMYEATIDLLEKRGYSASASIYDSLKEAELKNQDILKEKYQSLSQALDEAVSSRAVVKYSEQWYQMQNEILAVEQAILQSNIALAEYDNALRDLEWSAFDKLHEEISEIYEETEFLDKLLSDEKKFNEDGSMTEAGQAALGLHAVNYKMHLAQAEEYAQELERIKEALAKDPYNQALLDRQDELEEKHREALTNARDDEQAMIDSVSEGYDTLLDYMDQMIDKRKNMLFQAKDLYEYEKNIAQQTKEITSLEKQLVAYQGDDSEEARATIQKLQVSLSEAKDNLEETEYEKYISDQEEMLDTLRLQTEEWINARLDNEDQLLKDIVSSTEKNAAEIKDTLTEVASSTGTTLSEAMKTIWSNEGDIGKAIAEIKTYLAGMQKNADEKAKEQVQDNTPTSSDSGTTAATAPTSSTHATTSVSKWGDFFVKKSDSYPKGKLNTETSIVDRLKCLNYDSSFSARSRYYTAMGGSGIYTGSSSQNRWMIAQMKAHSGFARGGIIGDMIRAAGEDGIALVRRGEGIIPTNMVPEWNALIHHLPQLNNSMLGSIPQHQTNVSIDIGDIQMYGVNDPEAFAQQLKQVMLYNNSIRNIMKDTTIGEAIGRNSMIRYTR